ncbi:MAG: hypothetical protein HY720_20490 [Planctomycetes bacterium]|nr:hypothetical protein [Planctomycetota bacterium]
MASPHLLDAEVGQVLRRFVLAGRNASGGPSFEGEGTVYIAEPPSREEGESALTGIAGGFGIGCCGTGLGVVLAILGLVLGLVLKKKEALPPQVQ